LFHRLTLNRLAGQAGQPANPNCQQGAPYAFNNICQLLLSGFHVDLHNTTSLEISHLLFADDTLIMCDVDQDQILNLDHILLCFEAISGLKINLRKSKLVTVGHEPNQEELADILSCSISSLPLKYLGLPLGAPFKSKAIWDG
jgi:hypothetical protein